MATTNHFHQWLEEGASVAWRCAGVLMAGAPGCEAVCLRPWGKTWLKIENNNINLWVNN
jgi:hypothetical protein